MPTARLVFLRMSSEIRLMHTLGISNCINGDIGHLEIIRQKHLGPLYRSVAAPFLIMGNYNKMVKQHDSDAGSDSRADMAA